VTCKTEIAALLSLLMGFLSFFKETQQPGANRPHGPGNGKIELNATGTLTSARLLVLMREMGIDQESTFRHIRIESR
jgi:hypothetical protein